MADRTIVDVTCPGSIANAVVLAVFPFTMYGVRNPRNNGPYPLAIGALDKFGNLLNPRHPLELMPGDSKDLYLPPANTEKIIAVGFTQFTGKTALEYDTPNA